MTKNRPAQPGARNLWRVALLAPLALLLGSALPARAAHLDEALLKEAPKILATLKKKGFTTVGVLPFKVQKGARKASYTVAPLTASLPGRLENALILGQGDDEDTAIHVLAGAASVANKQKVGSYQKNDIAFRKLFDLRYPLAWGNKKEKADVFLTGVVVSSGENIEKTKVQIQYFTPKSKPDGKLELTDLGKPIEVSTDRSLLRDLGYAYALPRSVLKRGTKVAKREAIARRQVQQQEQGQKPQQSSGTTPDNIAGMSFELRYDGKKVPLRKVTDGGKGPQYEAPAPEEGTEVTMVLTRLAEDSKMLGVVLKVNGRSTWQFEDAEPIKCKKWLYAADRVGQADPFLGFYEDSDDKNVRKFEVVTGKEAEKRASELGERAGWIDIDVFASSDEEDDDPKNDEEEKKGGDEQEMKVSTRGMALKRGDEFSTLAALQKKLRKVNHLKAKKSQVVKRGPGGLILTENEPSDTVAIDKGKLPNPVRIGGISIRYYKRGKTPEPDDDE
jgi:hypothetical protein